MKPNRHLVFLSFFAWIFLGANFINDSLHGDGDLSFGIGFVISSLVYFVVGVFIIYNEKARDKLFPVESCPSCKSVTITIKDKLKSAPDETRSYCYCRDCDCKLKLHYSFYFFSLTMIFFPIAAILISGSVVFMFFVVCVSIPSGLKVFSKYIPLTVVKSH